MSVDLADFVRTGVFGPVARGATQAEVVAAFGQPQVLTPARRSYPTMLVYGDVEIRLRADSVTAVVLDLPPDRPPESPIATTGLWPPEQRTPDSIAALLAAAGVAWSTDDLMSEPDQPVWVTEHEVHLAFQDGQLHRTGAYVTDRPRYRPPTR